MFNLVPKLIGTLFSLKFWAGIALTLVPGGIILALPFVSDAVTPAR